MPIIMIFCAALLLCLFFDISIIIALLFGLLLFLYYGHRQGHSLSQLRDMAMSGVRTLSGVLLVFAMVGFLTALWRASGTLPLIICYAVELITPRIMVLMSFLLCCGVSFLIGTSVGTAATMGIICMTVGCSMGFPPALLGGAVLSGCFFGDRCSPVSTSAMLVSGLTGTDQLDNIRRMFRSAALPFIISCMLYFLLGRTDISSAASTELYSLFSAEFKLHWLALLPAAVLLLLAVLRFKVLWAMLASIAVSFVLALLLQHQTLIFILKTMILGFEAAAPEAAALLNGGGLVSMLKVIAIVCISSTYSGLFRGTGLLDSLKSMVDRLGRSSTPFCAMTATSLITGAVACNQMLTVMLTHQLCADIEPDPATTANHLEDTAIVISPLIPWSIACSVPLSVASAPMKSIQYAYYLLLIPFTGLLHSFLIKYRAERYSGKESL